MVHKPPDHCNRKSFQNKHAVHRPHHTTPIRGQYLQSNNLNIPIEVETRNLDEVKEALQLGIADRIMLDNFTPDQIREALKIINKQVTTEASGGITIANLREYADTGVDYISIGALTHSVKSLDLSLKIF